MTFRILKRKRTYFIFILTILTIIHILINYGVSFSVNPEKLINDYRSMGIDLKIKQTKIQSTDFQYLEISKAESLKPILMFVHGTPGAAAMFKEFLSDKELIKHADMISMDRLGYGDSDPGNSYPELKSQAEQLHHLVSQYPNRKIIAIGHSFGGPIIVKQAIEYPNDLDALILLAPALDPEYERFEGLAKLAWWKLTSWYFPKLFRVAADEKLAHRNELIILQNAIKQINVPVLHIHGTNDWMVPYENLEFAEQHFKPEVFTPITLEESSHFLFTGNDFVKVKEEILKFMDVLDKKAE